MLAALMLSMMTLTTALLFHAVVMNDERPGAQPVSVTERGRADHSRQLVFVRGR
jgi:hypothetical protein